MDDAATALVRFKNGAMGTIEATRMALGRKNHNRFEINGSLGSVAFDLERMNELEVYFESGSKATRGFRRILVTEPVHPYIKAWWPPGHIIGYEHTFTHTVFDLLEAMADEAPAPAQLRGRRAQSARPGRHREGLECEAMGRRSAVMCRGSVVRSPWSVARRSKGESSHRYGC